MGDLAGDRRGGRGDGRRRHPAPCQRQREQRLRHRAPHQPGVQGRTKLVSGGLELAGDRPVWGWGSGSFGAAFQKHIKRARTVNSHSEPVTVLAEQGAIGAAVYLATLAVALFALLRGAAASAARAAVAACFIALIVHSLGYGSFIIDPATWALLGLGLALARQAPPQGALATGAAGISPGSRFTKPREPTTV